MNKDKQGFIYRVVTGACKGLIGLAVNTKQTPNFYNYNKVFIELYNDEDLESPCLDENKKHLVALKNRDDLDLIGTNG